jgi:hypothetical protein
MELHIKKKKIKRQKKEWITCDVPVLEGVLFLITVGVVSEEMVGVGLA